MAVKTHVHVNFASLSWSSLLSMEGQFYFLILMTAAKSLASETYSSENCCWIDIPHGYCGISLPKDPMDIMTSISVQSLEEIDEVKLSYTINLRLLFFINLFWRELI